jgi:hypothetical protein
VSSAPIVCAPRGNFDGERIDIQRATYVLCWVWPSFTLLDVYMAAFLYTATPMWHFLAMRIAEEAVFLAVYQMALRPSIPVKLIRLGWYASVAIGAIFISLMALGFGALNSVYMHGLSVGILIFAVMLPARWQAGAALFTPFALTHPIVMGIAAAFSSSIHAQWTERDSIFTFTSSYVFVLSSAVVGVLSSHLVWAARQQLYQARKLGRYRLQVPIGEGGMNQVWLAWDTRLRRNVALKILRPDGGSHVRKVQRFEREAQAASKLTNPHTIRVFDFGASDDGIYYIAMEYLCGADLRALVDDHGPMPPARVVHFAMQACSSLAEAHDVGVIHRDVKPHNLFVTRAGDDHDFLKLLDFGIARMMEVENDEKLTQTGVIAGTPAFMAPEVCHGGSADARSDVYALGATMYFLLTGTAPFTGLSHGQMMAAHLLQTPERPSARRGEPLPEGLEQVVLRCLAKDPRDRFQTAREVADALAELVDVASWTADDAEAFWQVERTAKRERCELSTLYTLETDATETAGP